MNKYLILFFIGLSMNGYGQSFFKVGVKTGDDILYGVVNMDAKYVIDPIFNKIEMENLENGDNVFLVEQEKKQGLLDHQGDTIMDIKYEDIFISTCYSNYIIAKKDNKWGYYSNKGHPLISHKYDSAGEFRADTAIAYIKNRVYVLTINGKARKSKWEPNKIKGYYITGCYSVNIDIDMDVSLDADIIIEDGKYGVFDSARNKWIITQHYQNIIFNRDSGYFFVQLENKWAFFRAYGKKFSEFKYHSISFFPDY